MQSAILYFIESPLTVTEDYVSEWVGWDSFYNGFKDCAIQISYSGAEGTKDATITAEITLNPAAATPMITCLPNPGLITAAASLNDDIYIPITSRPAAAIRFRVTLNSVTTVTLDAAVAIIQMSEV